MRKADNLPPSRAVVTKSGNLYFLEPSGPVQAYNGTALPKHYLKLRLVDVIRVVLEATDCEGLDCIYLAQDSFQWWALVQILG